MKVSIMKKEIFSVFLFTLFINLQLFAQPGLTVSITFSTNALCNGDSTGSATATAFGGMQPYSYSWDDPNNTTSAMASNLPAGTWTVTVTDNNGSTATASVTLIDPEPIIIDITSINTTDCTVCNGSATANAAGGTGVLTYSWDNGFVGATVNQLCAGVYTVTVSDQNMCSQSESTTIISESGSQLLISVLSSESTCGANNGAATVNVDSGLAPFSYQWDDPLSQTTSTAENLAPGTYNVIVSDANGCSAFSSATVGSSEEIVAEISATSTTLTVNIASATSYQWINCSDNSTIAEANEQSYTPISDGFYAVVVTLNNCLDTSDCYQFQLVGLETFLGDRGFKIYPNPVQDLLNIESDLFLKSIVVAELNGKKLYENTELTTQIDLSAIQPGFYILTLTTENGIYAKSLQKR
jgi:hypothetical protein